MNRIRLSFVYYTILNLLVGFLAPLAPRAMAAEFTGSGVLFEAMDDANAISTTVGDRVIVFAKPNTAGTEASVKVTFPTGFTVSATAANWTTATTNLPVTIGGSTVSAWASIGSAAASVSGQAVTFAGGDLTVGTMYAFVITGGLTMPDVAADTEYTNGLVTSQTSVPATIDESEWATEVLLGTSADNIAVTATVDANFEYTLVTTAIGFGTLSDASISSSSGNAITIATNADNGYTIMVRSAANANQGMYSTAENYTLDATGSIDGTPETLSAGTEQYALDVNLTTAVNDTANGTSGTVPTASEAEYNGSTSQGGSLNQAALAEVARRDGRTTGDVWSLVLRTTISDATPEATDYTDTLDVVAAGLF